MVSGLESEQNKEEEPETGKTMGEDKTYTLI